MPHQCNYFHKQAPRIRSLRPQLIENEPYALPRGWYEMCRTRPRSRLSDGSGALNESHLACDAAGFHLACSACHRYPPEVLDGRHPLQTRTAGHEAGGSSLAIRGCPAHQFGIELRRSSTSPSSHHARSAVCNFGFRSQGESEFHHRHRRACSQSVDSSERRTCGRPACSSNR